MHQNQHIRLSTCPQSTGWRRPIGCLKLPDIFRKRATNHRALLRKMTHKYKASYDSKPPCSNVSEFRHFCSVQLVHPSWPLPKIDCHSLQHTLQHTHTHTTHTHTYSVLHHAHPLRPLPKIDALPCCALQHTLQRTLQRTLQHTLQYTLQHTLPHTLQHTPQNKRTCPKKTRYQLTHCNTRYSKHSNTHCNARCNTHYNTCLIQLLWVRKW